MYEDAKEEYEKIERNNDYNKGIKALWKNGKGLVPKIACALILPIAFWYRFCRS